MRAGHWRRASASPCGSWGARIRRRFAGTVLAVLIGWPLAGVLLGVLLQMPLGRLLVIWFVPALGMLLTASDLYRRQAETAATRSRVLALVAGRFPGRPHRPVPPGDPAVLARQVQDVLLATRRTQARVPDWFFLHFRPRDRVDFQREVTDLAGSADPVPPPSTPPGQPSP
ncbi:S-4TM family putative pore-forming effector [Actinoplanes sp. NPDC051851]|uniref:S-4TM family putative pore-forming effector n=1 Tax=Actinoplanes sp. NPDC051851 TaxID=3154753 RepID=UPI003414A461